jgi:polyhydroxyalkanoate synthesis regulator phasin
MPQPKSAKTASSAVKSAGRAATSAGRKKPAAGAGGEAGNPPVAGTTEPLSSSPEAQAARDEALRANLVQLRELLAGGVMLTAQRVQEAMDDAVRRGKMTRRDAEELARGLVDTGRRQSFDLLAEIEQLLGRSRTDLTSASSLVRDKTDRVLREVDRVRRTAGVGVSFPITGYDELTAAQITSRLADLGPADLRRVRDHEQAHANRKTVIAAIEKALA